MDWWLKWLGREFKPGTYECTHFTSEVMAAEFGINLPQWSPPASHRACDRAAPDLRARMLGEPVSDPTDGDCALMKSTIGRRLRGWHVGVVVQAARPSVLHCLTGCGSVLTPVDRLDHVGLKMEGIYRWAT